MRFMNLSNDSVREHISFQDILMVHSRFQNGVIVTCDHWLCLGLVLLSDEYVKILII